jgi:hypothetical protein
MKDRSQEHLSSLAVSAIDEGCLYYYPRDIWRTSPDISKISQAIPEQVKTQRQIFSIFSQLSTTSQLAIPDTSPRTRTACSPTDFSWTKSVSSRHKDRPAAGIGSLGLRRRDFKCELSTPATSGRRQPCRRTRLYFEQPGSISAGACTAKLIRRGRPSDRTGYDNGCHFRGMGIGRVRISSPVENKCKSATTAEWRRQKGRRHVHGRGHAS